MQHTNLPPLEFNEQDLGLPQNPNLNQPSGTVYPNENLRPESMRSPANPPINLATPPVGTPGIYTRAEGQDPQELDMLWGGSKLHKEDRSPLVFFFAGFILAAVLTSLVFLLFVRQPEATVAGDSSAVSAPVETTTAAPAKTPETTTKTEATKSAETTTETSTEAAATSVTNAGNSSTVGYTVYEVKSGDTLGSIAGKFYDNSSPDMVEKIRRANNLKSIHSLSLGQKLTIPAKN